MACEVSWFAALCDDDYEFLGVTDPALQSSWEHCRNIALAAEEGGYDNLLLPSGYTMGIDSVSFAAGIAPLLHRMQLLVAVRIGEMWPPQLARQLATLDQMLRGRLTVNIISSDLPGQKLESGPRYRRTLEIMRVLRDLLDGKPADAHGEFVDLRFGYRAHVIVRESEEEARAAARRLLSRLAPCSPADFPAGAQAVT
jgi:alkanesulfonate monooxygenase